MSKDKDNSRNLIKKDKKERNEQQALKKETEQKTSYFYFPYRLFKD